MTVNEQEKTIPSMEKIPYDGEIILSGIAGRFPESDNMNHFRENLMNKVDLITNDDRRWKSKHPEIPRSTGKVNNLEKFDASFFGIDYKVCHTMDPMMRILLEHAYEAVIDAGLNPQQLRGTKTGVFIGACVSESSRQLLYEKLTVNGLGLTGCSRAMLANRISHWLGLSGPSYQVDTACSSSLTAMEVAYRAIREGLCDAAFVGGANLCLHPYVSLQFFRLGVLSPDGHCKSFDDAANGYARSEAISVVFLQKAKDAKRVYATFVHAKTNSDGFKEQGITFPSRILQSQLIEEFYKEIGLPPTILDYIEAHATGTQVGDPEEINALDVVLCTGRKEPLLAGSIKSNLGHAEPASGVCSIAKVVIGMESGLIPPNLHLTKLREGVDALQKGRLRVVTEPTPWKGGYVGINSFGFGGANAHILLKSNPKEKINGGQPNDDLPRLVAVSGRTQEAVETLLNDIESRPCDVEYVRLLHDIHSEDIKGHLYRGYTLIPSRGIMKNRVREINNYVGEKRPVWFVFSGLESQWTGVEHLLCLPAFNEAIKRCGTILKPYRIDIMNIITSKEKKISDNVLYSYVVTAAVQIGIVDLLHFVGIVPNSIVGYSMGELGCAYADGCLTTEQMILIAYFCGVVCAETKIISGSMAEVELKNIELKKLCPPDIDIAYHNSINSAIVSGPEVSMKNFIKVLQAKNIFVREVPCNSIPYHSRYLEPMASHLMAYLEKVIPSPKPRSAKWLSSSVPQENWQTATACLSSAQYFVRNLLSQVLVQETLASIPKNAVIIEISPHGQLHNFLRSLPATITNISLIENGCTNTDNLEVFMEGIGKLYNAGLQPQLHKLYPNVSWPVSRSTPMISPLIKWDHSDDWFVSSFRMDQISCKGGRSVSVTLAEDDFEYISGHVIDGRNLFPATGYLTLIWETLSMTMGHGDLLLSELSVIFEDVKFLRATNVPAKDIIDFTLIIERRSGQFEVIEGRTVIVTGRISAFEKSTETLMSSMVIPVSEEEVMTSRDIYKELRLRGYNYSGLFRGLRSATTNGSRGHIEWRNNWVAFMDNMLQMQILGLDSRGLFVPTGITKLVIDVDKHINQVCSIPGNEKLLPVFVNKTLNVIVSGGIEIRGVKASAIARRKPAGEPVLETYKFISYLDRAEITLQELAILISQVALENQASIKVKTVEFLKDDDQIATENLLSPWIAETLAAMPLIQPDINIISNNTAALEEAELPTSIVVGGIKKVDKDCRALIAIGHELFLRHQNFDLLLSSVIEGGFVLSRESTDNIKEINELVKGKGLPIIMEKKSGKELFILIRKREKVPKKTVVLKVSNNQFGWVEEMKTVMKQELEQGNANTTRIVYVSEGNFENGLIGFINCLRREPDGEIARGILIQDPKAPKFSLEDPFYAHELQKDMAVSVLDPNGRWGNYRHLPLPALVPNLVSHARVNELVRGDLSSLSWLEGPIQIDSNNKNLVNVFYSSINFKDVMLATGKLAVEVVAKTRQSQECVLGFEYSGITNNGKRVMGIIESRAMTNFTIADEYLTWEVPAEWSLEDAATVPCVYGTCYYALYINGKIKKGDKVLIHAGSGGVGQAAITLALHEGCEVFTTVGTPEKRAFIRKHFPAIDEAHIGNSRDTSFEQMIMRQTNGKGVDIVLNSLAEEKLHASVRCLGIGGRFLEIGKFDLAANNRLSMECFQREISYHGIMLDNLIFATAERKKQLSDLMRKNLEINVIKPLTRTVFAKDQLEAAFRFMGTGKHIGKVIIQVRDEKELTNELVMALPRFHCLEDRSYIILGGLGGFGLELADWLVLRGARNLVITSRTGIRNGYQTMRVKLWESYGTKVVIVSSKDVSKYDDCRTIIETAARLAPVDAIFNLAVVLKDAIWRNQTPETFEESFQPKAWSTKHFDSLTRKLCPKLRQFVVFSSVSCGRGNAGQTNYGMSNSVMERICESRAAEGLPGLAVQWGAIGDVGLVADMQEDNKELVIGGTLQQKISSCLKELDGFLCQDQPIVSSMVVAEKKVGGGSSRNIVNAVLDIMGLKDLKSVSPQTPLAEIGMDSMMGVEIKQTLEREFEIFLTPQDIRTLNFAKLQKFMTSESVENETSGDTNESSDSEDTHFAKMLLRLIGKEENVSETRVKLNTKNEKDRNCVFLIPGIEGVAGIFKELASKIRAPAYCLQLNIEANVNDSIASLADNLLPHFLDLNNDRRNFELIAYSYGSLIAIELTRLLEAHGLEGKLIVIDGAPEIMKRLVMQIDSDDSKLQNYLLLNLVQNMTQVLQVELLGELEKLTTWEEKLNLCMTRVPEDSSSLSYETRRILTTATYYRLLYLKNYETSNLNPIKTPIILLKPNTPTVSDASEDYGLSKVTSGKVEVHCVEGNHTTILDNDKVAMVINGESLDHVEK